MVIFHSYVKLSEGICLDQLLGYYEHRMFQGQKIPKQSQANEHHMLQSRQMTQT
jgi:hypothetical protein